MVVQFCTLGLISNYQLVLAHLVVDIEVGCTVREAQLAAYGYVQAEVHTDMQVAAGVEDDVYIHSYVLGLENLVHTLKVRILDRHMGWEVDLVQLAKTLAASHAGSLGKLWVLSQFVKMDVGAVGPAAVEKAVLVVRERVVVGTWFVLSSMFAGSKVLVIASMVIDDATVATKQKLVICKDWVLDHRC